MLKIRQDGGTYSPPAYLAAKYTTPSLCVRDGGKTMYAPLVTRDGYADISPNRYGYDENSYPRVAFRHDDGKTYFIANKFVPKVTFNFATSSSSTRSSTTYYKTLTTIATGGQQLSEAMGIYFSPNNGSTWVKAGILNKGSVSVTVNYRFSGRHDNYMVKLLRESDSAAVMQKSVAYSTTSVSGFVPKGFW